MASSFITNILFPTDFSDNAQNALPFALEIARQTNATLHILHSIEEPYDFAPMVEEIKKGVTRKVRQLFDNMLLEIKKEEKYKDITFKTLIQTGRIIYTLMEETNNHNVDLVVMGTKGRSGLEKILFGSTTAEMIQHSEVPVLAIPQKASFSGFKQVLFTTDYHDYDLDALKYITELGKHFDSKIKVLHSSIDDDLKTDIMFRGFRELVRESSGCKSIEFEQATSTEFIEAVADQIELNVISLLVMIRYRKPYALLSKKNSQEMSYYTEIPLLVIPAPM